MTTLPHIRKGCEQGGLQGGQDAVLRRLQLCWQQAEEAEAAAKRQKTGSSEPEPSGVSCQRAPAEGEGRSNSSCPPTDENPAAESEEEFRDDDAVDSEAETIGRQLQDVDMCSFNAVAARKLLRALGGVLSATGEDAEPQPLRVYERTAFVHDLRYTRARIAARFGDGRHLNDLISELCSSRIVASSEAFLVLNVVRYRGRLFCLDNRRLWCLRQFQLQASHDVRVRVRVHDLGPVGRKFQALRPGGPPRILAPARRPGEAPPPPPMPPLPPPMPPLP